MIRVDGGEMMVGATPEQIDDAESNELPAHKVTVSTFYIGQFPVTQNVWELIMGYNKSFFRYREEKSNVKNSSDSRAAKGATAGACIGTTVPLSGIGMMIGGMAADIMKWWNPHTLGNQKNAGRVHGDDFGHYPVENLSHDEALEFVHRLSKMTNIRFALPTENEWEYAARGGQKSQGFKYAGSNDIDEVACYRDNADSITHPVGEKKPNELGLYDMSGNVWEWTETPAHSYASNIEPGGTIFIRRGGSWWHEAKNCRVSRRYASDKSKKTSGLGLRVVIRENVE